MGDIKNCDAAQPTKRFKDMGDGTFAEIIGIPGLQYETVAASQPDQVLGTTGALGDYLEKLLVVPSSTSPGPISVKDGGGAAITVFAGGASSIATLHPFSIDLALESRVGGWSVTTGANLSVIASGRFR